ncbi:MAG: hypothetical protein ABI665_07420 [Vicinamibacterales bacterium]
MPIPQEFHPSEIPCTVVYRRNFTLTAGSTHHFQTRNLRPVSGGANPDPFMYLLLNNTIVASNDDYTGLASEIIYTPATAGTYKVIIRAYTTSTPGLCDLYQGINGAAPALVESDIKFAGTYVQTRWHADEWFETVTPMVFGTSGTDTGGTAPTPADTYLFLITETQMYWDDDSGTGLDSKLVPPSAGSGLLIVGSWARYTEGTCNLALVNTSYLSPWLSPAPWSRPTKRIALTGPMKEYVTELQRAKKALDQLIPRERDRKVLELQRRMLPEEAIRLLAAPPPNFTPDFVRRQERFLASYAKTEKTLKRMSYAERSARLATMKRDAMGPEYSEPADARIPALTSRRSSRHK